MPAIVDGMGSKSREIRRAVVATAGELLVTWPAHIVDKHLASLTELIRKVGAEWEGA